VNVNSFSSFIVENKIDILINQAGEILILHIYAFPSRQEQK